MLERIESISIIVMAFKFAWRRAALLPQSLSVFVCDWHHVCFSYSVRVVEVMFILFEDLVRGVITFDFVVSSSLRAQTVEQQSIQCAELVAKQKFSTLPLVCNCYIYVPHASAGSSSAVPSDQTTTTSGVDQNRHMPLKSTQENKQQTNKQTNKQEHGLVSNVLLISTTGPPKLLPSLALTVLMDRLIPISMLYRTYYHRQSTAAWLHFCCYPKEDCRERCVPWSW